MFHWLESTSHDTTSRDVCGALTHTPTAPYASRWLHIDLKCGFKALKDIGEGHQRIRRIIDGSSLTTQKHDEKPGSHQPH